MSIKVAKDGERCFYIHSSEEDDTVAVTCAVVDQMVKVASIQLALDAAPTAQESLTATLNATEGASYDVALLDTPMEGLTSLIWEPDVAIYMHPGDSLDIAFPNSADATIGIRVFLEAV